jgi:glycerate 2-kinase
LINAAIEAGCGEIIVCIGGSATVDGGAGMLAALGWRFFDESDRVIPPPLTGGHLGRIARIEPSSRAWPRLRAACDVINPLCGSNGAARVFGPQKGATHDQVGLLDAGLTNLARVMGGDPELPGAGAAGGVGFALVNGLGATLERGIDLVLESVGFVGRCRRSQLVITGEGRLDEQSRQGKACITIARRAAALGVPCIALVGEAKPDARRFTIESGGEFQRVVDLSQRFGRDVAMADTHRCLEEVCAEMRFRPHQADG